MPPGAHRAVPSAHPVLNETNVTDTGSKNVPAVPAGRAEASAVGLPATRAPSTTRAGHQTRADNGDFLTVGRRAGHSRATARAAIPSLDRRSSDLTIFLWTPAASVWFHFPHLQLHATDT